MKKRIVIVLILIFLIILFITYINYVGAKTYIYNELTNQFETGYKNYIDDINAGRAKYPEDIMPDEVASTFGNEAMNGRYTLLEDSIDEYKLARTYITNKGKPSSKIDLKLNITPRIIVPTPLNTVYMIITYEEVIKLDNKIYRYGISEDLKIVLKKKAGKWEPVYMVTGDLRSKGKTLNAKYSMP